MIWNLRIWDLNIDQDLIALKPASAIHIIRVGCSPGGRALAAFDDGGRVLLWADGPSKPVRVLTGSCFSFDGPDRIVVGGLDGHLRWFDLATGEVRRDVPGHAGRIDSVGLSPGGAFVASSSEEGTRLIEVTGNGSLGLWPAHRSRFRADGRELALISYQGRVSLVEVPTGRESAHWRTPRGIDRPIYSPDGGRLAASIPDPTAPPASNTLLWEVPTGRVLGRFEGHPLAFLPDGSALLTGAIDGRVILTDLATGRADRVFSGHAGEVLRALFTRDGKRLLTSSRDSTIRAWDMATAQSILVLKGHNHWVNDLALAPRGEYLVSASHDSTVRIWPSGRDDWKNPTRLADPQRSD